MTFFEAYALVKTEMPADAPLWAIHLAAIEVAGLPCEHPFNCRIDELGFDYRFWMPIDRSQRFVAREEGFTLKGFGYCQVCQTWNPDAPVDTRAQRVLNLLAVLSLTRKDHT